MNLITIRTAMESLKTQLNTGSPSAGSDCGVLACINLILWASRGKIGPQSQAEVAEWVHKLRQIAHNMSRPMMIYGDIFEVLNSDEVRHMFTSKGLKPLKAYYTYGKTWTDVRLFLADSTNHAVMMPVDYGVLRRGDAPMGSTSFSGGHALVMVGMQQVKVKVGSKYRMYWHTLVGDSLMDGRRKPGSTSRYPKGWLRTRFYNYRKAAGAFGSAPDGSPRPIGEGRTVCVAVVRG